MVVNQQTIIRKFANDEELRTAALLLMNTDPWKTFGRSYAQCLDAVSNPQKESYGIFFKDVFWGVVVIDLNGPFAGYIQAACVIPSMRGKGLGSRLIQFAETRIFQFSPNSFLCYSDFNESVRPLYERLGYSIVGVLENYIIEGHNEFLMRKTLGPRMTYSTH